MSEATIETIEFPATPRDALTDLLRRGAQEMLAVAIEAEVDEYLAQREHLRDAEGHRQVVRNGRVTKRKITTGVGQIEIEQHVFPLDGADELLHPDSTPSAAAF